MQQIIETTPTLLPASQHPTANEHPTLVSQRRSWNRFSPGWKKWDAFTMRFLEPQGAAIVSAIEGRRNTRVLDIATGTGDPGLTLARRNPRIEVTGIDVSEGMLSVANEKALALGAVNYRAAWGNACDLGFSDGRFDAVACRLGLMFVPSVMQAVGEMARVLRPGGVLATTVWAGPSDNTWLTTFLRAARKHVDIPSPPSSGPGLFRCADPLYVPGLCERAGLRVERLEKLGGSLKYDWIEDYWRFMTEVVPPVVAALSDKPEDLISAVKAEVYAALEETSELGTDPCAWGAYCIVASK